MRSSMVPQLFHPYAKDIATLLLESINDDYYKICAESLRCSSAFFKVIKPDTRKPVDPKFAPRVPALYKAGFTRLKTSDIDQEVIL